MSEALRFLFEDFDEESSNDLPLLLGLWWPGATREGALAGMIGGSVVCVVWYLAGYAVHGSFDNWIGGLWPAFIGPLASLLLLVVVSRLTPPPPDEVAALFFADEA